MVQRFSVGRVYRHLSRNNDEPDLQGKEIHSVYLCMKQKKILSKKRAAHTAQHPAAHTAPSKVRMPSTRAPHNTSRNRRRKKSRTHSAERTQRRAHTASSCKHSVEPRTQRRARRTRHQQRATARQQNKKTKTKIPLARLWRCSTRCQQTRANDDASAQIHSGVTTPMT